MHRVIICYMHNIKYRLRYGQSVTCLFHSVKFFALTVRSSQLYLSHSEKSIANERTLISNHTTWTNKRSTKQTQKALATKQKALKCKGVDVLKGDRWNGNLRESTGKETSVSNCDYGHFEFKVNITPTIKCVNLTDNMSQVIRYAKRIT